jgi:hypothetical protein
VPFVYRRNTESGARANLFVGSNSPVFVEACDFAKTADPMDWRYGELRGRHGIWVNLYWRGDRPNNHLVGA